MANLWFRMYAEFADDPKVQMMSEAMQRRLAMLFCSKCKSETLHETERAFHWRISETELAETKALFIQKGFIDDDWNILNWNKRQFLSDSSTDRVRKYRQVKKQDETLHETPVTNGNVTVTPPDTDTDTDTEQTQKQKEPLALTSVEVPAGGVFDLPLIGDQGEWSVPQKLYDELVLAYPGVSVMAQLGEMRVWLLANTRNRKTRDGLPRFINSWLKKAQNEAPRGKFHGKPSKIDLIADANNAALELLQHMDTPAYLRGGGVEAGAGPRRLFEGVAGATVAGNAG